MMSTVSEVESLDGVPHALAAYLNGSQLPATGACWPEFAGLDWTGAGLTVEARPVRADDKLGITGVFCALAENGTLMFLSGEDTAGSMSLLPETHVAIVPVSRIVRIMEDGWDLLRRERDALPRQVNFVSGPSRTADIEMTLVLGAHGPFRVHVILVGR
jgi:L-lactate dehydrogenase complex protein LldG